MWRGLRIGLFLLGLLLAVGVTVWSSDSARPSKRLRAAPPLVERETSVKPTLAPGGSRSASPTAARNGSPAAAGASTRRVLAGFVITNAPPTGNGQLSESALRQIAALEQEKAGFTATQRKMDSQLVLAAKRSRNETIAGGFVPALRIGVTPDADGMVLVDIAASDVAKLEVEIQAHGGTIRDTLPQVSPVRAAVPLTEVENLAALSEVKFVSPVYPTMVNNTDPQGVTVHNDYFARTNFFVDGSNVRVGVLSDSVDYMSQGQAAGDLGPVTVLPGQSGVPNEGEGTAMLEIIHAMAPGAELYFATGTGPTNGPITDKQFATNILDLRFTYGCDIIVDDLTGLEDSPFQDTAIAQAVDAVTGSGGLYFSSAANSGNYDSGTSGTWEGDFLNGGAIGFPTNGFIHNFGTIGSPTHYDQVTQGNSGNATVLYWSDPIDASTNDYDLFVLDSSGVNVVSGSVNWQAGAQEPIEVVLPPATGERLVVVLASGTGRFLHIDTARGQLAIGTPGSTRGHNAATNAFSVAAVDAATAFPLVFTGGAANPVESFSSDGPRRMFYFPDGTPMTPGNFSSTGGIVFQKPDVAAANGVMTDLPPGGLNPFFGTSAAAPHAAAIAALLKSYNTNLTAAQIRALLTATALDIMAPGVDRDSGYGIVMPAAALAAAPALPPEVFVVTPGSAAAGREVFIYGFSLRTVTNVLFSGTAAAFSSWSNVLIVASVPAGASSGTLTVQSPFGSADAPFVVLPTLAPANDIFVNAIVLTGTAFVVSANTSGATKELGEPNHAGNSGGKSVWYRWTAPGNGMFSLDTIGSDFSTLLAVYTGSSLSSLTPVANSADSGGKGSNLLAFNATAGQTYQIAVDGMNGAGGSALLRLEPATTTVFATRFEPSEGYVSGPLLAGQNGWLSTGTGGNGIVTNFFSGQGQQAFLGFNSSTPATNTVLYHPLNYTLDTNNRPLVQFSVSMEIVDSNNGVQDQFWWIVQNASGHALFGLEFDNSLKFANYVLDTGSPQAGLPFYNGVIYNLVIAMDFGRGIWAATLNGVPLTVLPQPLTTAGAVWTLGNIDAVWVFNNSAIPGNNYLLFDNFTVTAGANGLPRILWGPQSQTVGAGDDVFLAAAASGGGLAYQWFFGTTMIPNATNASLTLRNVVSTQTGSYTVKISNSNGGTTGTALVTITNPPSYALFGQPSFTGGRGLQLNVTTAVGNNYRLQASTNLSDWVTVSSFYGNGPATLCLDPAAPEFGTRFYRLVSP